MSDENDNGRPQSGRAPLTLKPRGGSVSAGVVKQSFSHGRSKTVVVETKRARTHAPVAATWPPRHPAEKRFDAPRPRPSARPPHLLHRPPTAFARRSRPPPARRRTGPPAAGAPESRARRPRRRSPPPPCKKHARPLNPPPSPRPPLKRPRPKPPLPTSLLRQRQWPAPRNRPRAAPPRRPARQPDPHYEPSRERRDTAVDHH